MAALVRVAPWASSSSWHRLFRPLTSNFRTNIKTNDLRNYDLSFWTEVSFPSRPPMRCFGSLKSSVPPVLGEQLSGSAHSDGSSASPPKAPLVVSVFWDLDNKPPMDVPPFEAALGLREAASRFGKVVDLIAYANHHAFDYVPQWVREDRLERKVMDLEEKKGLRKADKPYICSFCGHKFATNVKLQKHFKQLHERERTKRLNRMRSAPARQQKRLRENNAERETRYREAAREIIVPRKGYWMASDLRRAGVFIRTVPDRPQAADTALKRDMGVAIKNGVDVICLVSDDNDFRPDLLRARSQRLRTVVIGDFSSLKSHADVGLSWDDVASGRVKRKADMALARWSEEKDLGLVMTEGDEAWEESWSDDEEGESVELSNASEEEDDFLDILPRRRLIRASAFDEDEDEDEDGEIFEIEESEDGYVDRWLGNDQDDLAIMGIGGLPEPWEIGDWDKDIKTPPKIHKTKRNKKKVK